MAYQQAAPKVMGVTDFTKVAATTANAAVTTAVVDSAYQEGRSGNDHCLGDQRHRATSQRDRDGQRPVTL